MAVRARGLARAALASVLLSAPAWAEPGKADLGPETWIFSGVLQESGESYSGTLIITGESDAQFELKLDGGATCDGGELHPAAGLVGLSEIRCTDGRTLHAMFEPQPQETLKVIGHLDDARFETIAHLLGNEPPSPPKPVPLLRVPMPPLPDLRSPPSPDADPD